MRSLLLFYVMAGLVLVATDLRAGDQVLLRVTDENENPIPDCRIYWKSQTTLDWQDPRVTYRIGPQGVMGDGSVLAKVRDTVPQAAEASRQLGDASINYSIVFYASGRSAFAVKVTAEGYEPVEESVGETTPSATRYHYKAIHLRRSRQSSRLPQPSPMPSQNASGEQGSYSIHLYFTRSNNTRAPNVEFKVIMNGSGRTVSGRTDREGEAIVTLPEYGPCKIVFYQPNGAQKTVAEVVAMNVQKDITVLY